MRVVFKTFQAGVGDCIFFCLKEGDRQYAIMVDCGRFSQAIRDYVEKELNKRIDLLVVTHIDADHVEGVTALLNDMPDLDIGEIWFNSYKRENGGVGTPLSEKQIECLKRLYGKIPQVIDVLNTKVNAEHAITLSETILSNPTWEDVWRRAQIKVGITDYLLCDGAFGKLRIISPTQKALDALDDDFLELFYEFFYGEHPDGALEKDTTIYELLLRVAQEREADEQAKPEQISSLTLNGSDIKAFCNNKTTALSPENKASIAFVWEYGEHKILFLGDASPDVVKSSLEGLYGKSALLYDAVKVSHHGSAHSTSVKLMELVDSPHFFFTGGSGNKRPHIEAISRIINRPLKNVAKPCMLHFNFQNEWTKELESSDLQQQFGYTLDFSSNELKYGI